MDRSFVEISMSFYVTIVIGHDIWMVTGKKIGDETI